VTTLLWIAGPLILIAAIRPWTIRPIDEHKPAVFEPGAFTASAWPRLLREASQNATDISEVVATSNATPAKARFVKGSGVVTDINRQSRVGVMHVRVTGTRPATVAIQVGPVVRGTALRDASSFIQFSDFLNQFDYAGAANALNDYALRTVAGRLPIDTLQGRTITFIGAVGKSAPREGEVVEIVPMQLDLVGTAPR
jgi:predicted lipoprotein